MSSARSRPDHGPISRACARAACGWVRARGLAESRIFIDSKLADTVNEIALGSAVARAPHRLARQEIVAVLRRSRAEVGPIGGGACLLVLPPLLHLVWRGGYQPRQADMWCARPRRRRRCCCCGARGKS